MFAVKMKRFSNRYLWLGLLFLWTHRSAIDCRPNTTKRPTCQTEACLKSAQLILDSMDKTVDPCDDFYQYACGGFISKNKIPEDGTTISRFHILSDVINQQIKESLEAPIDATEPKFVQKCKQFYRTCMDTAAIEKLGTSKVSQDFQELGGWPVVEGDAWKEDNFNWTQMIFKLEELGYDANLFFRFALPFNLKNSTRRQLQLQQPDLNVARTYLANGTSNHRVKAYSSYARDISKLFGAKAERIDKEIGKAIQFQVEMAKIFLNEEDLVNISVIYNPMSLKEVKEKFSYFPWLEFINHMYGSDNFVDETEIVNVATPKYLEDFGQLVARTSKRVLANYIFIRVLLNVVDYLPEKFLQRRDKFVAEVVGNSARPPRYKMCGDKVHGSLSFGVSHLYIKKYFKNGTKDAATEMVNELLKSAKQNINSTTWMDKKTRRNALAKLENINRTIAYPDEILDEGKIDEFYKDIIVDEHHYFISATNIMRFLIKDKLKQLKEPIEKEDWKNKGSIVNVDAYYRGRENSITLPAGILQGVFFNVDRPKYMNFGGMGMIIGHEITHAFDNKGSQFDKDGNLINWWTPQTLETFNNKSQCMIEQYSNVTVPEVGKNLNGAQCLSENIADNGGLKEAYAAYNEWVKQKGEEESLPGLELSPKQLFWLTNANVWCGNMRKGALEEQIDTNSHSPLKYRVNIPFGNSEDFIRDYQCKKGTKMNPSTKCSLW